jgi:hypothetical protein
VMDMDNRLGAYCDDTGRTERIVKGVKLRPGDVPRGFWQPKYQPKYQHTSHTSSTHAGDDVCSNKPNGADGLGAGCTH